MDLTILLIAFCCVVLALVVWCLFMAYDLGVTHGLLKATELRQGYTLHDRIWVTAEVDAGLYPVLLVHAANLGVEVTDVVSNTVHMIYQPSKERP